MLAWSKIHKDGYSLNISWIYGVIRNKIGDFYRSPRNVREFLCDRVDIEIFSEDFSSRAEIKIFVARLLHRLPDRHREILELTYLMDLPPKKVAEILCITIPSYRVRLHRAHNALSKIFLRKGLAEM